jgi:hypothetical protein
MSIAMLFSVTVPLIAPAAVLFFACKLATDKVDILVMCPTDSEREAGLSYAKLVPLVAVASLIMFNSAMLLQ